MAVDVSIVLIDSDLFSIGDEFFFLMNEEQISGVDLNDGRITSGSRRMDLM